MATANYRKKTTTDLTEFQAFLADRRLARDNQIPYFVRWVERFLWHCHGRLRANTPRRRSSGPGSMCSPRQTCRLIRARGEPGVITSAETLCSVPPRV